VAWAFHVARSHKEFAAAAGSSSSWSGPPLSSLRLLAVSPMPSRSGQEFAADQAETVTGRMPGRSVLDTPLRWTPDPRWFGTRPL
jgi:hypothetical protein